MVVDDRLEQIASLIDEHGFLSVKELSRLVKVSEMTIRRDLQRLDEEQRVRRTYGGAMSLRAGGPTAGEATKLSVPAGEGFWIDTVDVLVATAVTPGYDKSLLERAEKRRIPVVAESLSMDSSEAAVVAVDNYQAGVALGRWAGNYARERWGGEARVLDLGYPLANTQARSQGFIRGLREVLPDAQVVLSINAQSRYSAAYQLAADALTVHPDVNIVFAINDTIAWGTINACQDLGRDPDSLLVLPFGLEGDTLKDALMAGGYCKAGLAMFPEIVAPVCIEAALAAYNHEPLAHELTTPHAVLTPSTLSEYYVRDTGGWRIRWGTVKKQLSIPLPIFDVAARAAGPHPKRLGFVVPFSEHEWYRNLIACMQAHAEALGIEMEVVDADQSLKSELDRRRRRIAQAAAELVAPGDAVLIDCGQTATYLAEELTAKQNLTVITNSIPVFDALKTFPNLTLISTGGVLRHTSDSLTGPTAEGALRELRADKLFLVVSGISLDFGLSHTNLAEVAMKQAMIRAARKVILLADYSAFGQESIVQVAPLSAVHRLVTDDTLPASTRLELTKLGIEVVTVRL